jgi:hypothetical protein
MEELRARLEAARIQVKSLQRATRTTGQVLSSLLEEIDELLDAQPKEGTANERNSSREPVVS